MTVGGGSKLDGHAMALPIVESSAADLGEVPVWPEVAGAHLRVRFKAAASQHHGLGTQLDVLATLARAHALHPAIRADESYGGRIVEHFDAGPFEGLVQRFDELRAAAEQVTGETAPELELAVDLERLPAECGLEANALLLEPQRRGVALADEDIRQIRVAAVLGQPMHVVVVLLGRVAAEIDVGEVEVANIRGERDEVLDSAEREAEGTAGEGRVTAASLFRRRLQHGDGGAHLARLQRRIGRRIAGTNHQHVDAAEVGSGHSDFPSLSLLAL